MKSVPRSCHRAHGGNTATQSRLDTFFTQLNAGTQEPYAFMGNEPDFQDPWLYDFVGAPAKTAAVLRRIQDELYTNKPGGMSRKMIYA